MTDLPAQLKDARRSLVLRLAADLDADAGGPEPGFVQLLAHLQTAIEAVEAVLADDA